MKLKKILEDFLTEEELGLEVEENGSPYKMWVDTNKTYIQGKHAYRLKVGNGPNETKDFIPFIISESPEIPPKIYRKLKSERRLFIPDRDIKNICFFIRENLKLFTLLNNNEIDFEEFKKRLVKYHT